MDLFKQKTIKDYTACDLNCPYIVNRTKQGKKLIKIFKRKARRNLKQELKNNFEEGDNNGTKF